jgi:hypothetical protein
MIELSETTHQIYDYFQLKEMTGQSLTLNAKTEEICINNIFIYNSSKISIRGERGSAIFIDFFNKKNQNIATLPVYNHYKLVVSNFARPNFDTIKN